MSDLDIDAIEKRAEAAPAGPWALEQVGDWHDRGYMIADIIRDPKGTNALDFGTDQALGEFVSHARVDVPALIAEVKRLRADVATLTADRDQALEESARSYSQGVEDMREKATRICDDWSEGEGVADVSDYIGTAIRDVTLTETTNRHPLTAFHNATAPRDSDLTQQVRALVKRYGAPVIAAEAARQAGRH